MEEHSKTTDGTAAGYLPAAGFDPIELDIRKRVPPVRTRVVETGVDGALGRGGTNAWWVSPKATGTQRESVSS